MTLEIKGKVGELIDAINLAALAGGTTPIMQYLHLTASKGQLALSQRDTDKMTFILARFKKFQVTGEGYIFFKTQSLLDYLKLASRESEFTINKTEDNKFLLTLPDDKDTIREIQPEYDTHIEKSPFKILDNIAYFTEEKPQTHVIISSSELKKLTTRNNLKSVLYYPLHFSATESYSEIAKYDADKKGMKTKLTATVEGQPNDITIGAIGENLVSTINGDWHIHITTGYPAVWLFQENDSHKIGIVMALRTEEAA